MHRATRETGRRNTRRPPDAGNIAIMSTTKQTKQSPVIRPAEGVSCGATLSTDELFRYLLTRLWDDKLPPLVVIGLNPSVADDKIDDRTIAKLTRLARRWNFGSLRMLNLFAYRATDPERMKAALKDGKPVDPIGGDFNDRVILQECRGAIEQGGKVIAGWGNHGTHNDRSAHVVKMLRENGIPFHVFKLNDNGEPAHPLYLPEQTLVPVLYEDALRELNARLKANGRAMVGYPPAKGGLYSAKMWERPPFPPSGPFREEGTVIVGPFSPPPFAELENKEEPGEFNVQFPAYCWRRIADRLPEEMRATIHDGIAQTTIVLEEVVSFSVTKEERKAIRRAASDAGVYEELGITNLSELDEEELPKKAPEPIDPPRYSVSEQRRYIIERLVYEERRPLEADGGILCGPGLSCHADPGVCNLLLLERVTEPRGAFLERGEQFKEAAKAAGHKLPEPEQDPEDVPAAPEDLDRAQRHPRDIPPV